MMRDVHIIFRWVLRRLERYGHDGPLFIMGRSLGSASALELAAGYPEDIDGIIIESGFSYMAPLLELLGIRLKAMGIKEEEGTRNVDKIRKYDKPTLIIHAEFDHIIPFSEGEELYNSSPAEDKKMIKIPQADHNTIFQYGMSEYLAAVREFVKVSF
jgi:pimeloyl-ACP methyl ester carboxylesterase